MSIINDALKRAQRKDQADRKEEEMPVKKKLSIQPKSIAVGVIVLALGLIAIFVFLRPKKITPPPQAKKVFELKTTTPQGQIGTAITEPGLLSEEEIELPYLKVSGIAYEPGGKSYAVINNKIVEVGDEIEGAQISKIGSELVTVLFNDEEFELRLK